MMSAMKPGGGEMTLTSNILVDDLECRPCFWPAAVFVDCRSCSRSQKSAPLLQ